MRKKKGSTAYCVLSLCNYGNKESDALAKQEVSNAFTEPKPFRKLRVMIPEWKAALQDSETLENVEIRK